ncbi:ABC transporter ATP-binding protein [Oceanispirochaeta crateris]|uniref:ABC transporter ATP-binding protein n=1 Tax=Oceanispirochaeta crateris TaxID=2518645 RepID=A0A5C1QQG2_9SPIO|nr:ABC transporter ATP-binding protein [Oceanispirochaeta crateris]QEN08854.1 ABC transporter ATP-binding protein [Oceanispirochaeta crateris]
MIKAIDLTKRYGKHTAVNKINFEIGKGEIIGFLGPNGAGKSTTMNMITGYIAPTDGQILVDGENILDDPEKTRGKIGYLPEHPPLYMDMTVNEYLKFSGQLKKISKPDLIRDMDRISELVKISDVRKRLIKNLSKGYKQRVGLAQALLGNPQLLILDEPTVGLDPKQIIEIRNLIKDLSENHTIVLSSHILPEISAVCDRVLIISKGDIVASDTPENLAQNLAGKHKLHLRVKGGEEQIREALEGLNILQDIHMESSREEGVLRVIVEAAKDADIREDVFYALAEQKCPILQMRPMDMTLEEIFLNLTTVEGGKK